CFGVFGAMAWLRGHHSASVTLWSLGGLLAVVYYAVKPLQRLMFDSWMAITYPIGWAVSHLLMAIVFYLVITPVGLLMRLLGRDPLNRAFDPARQSYWIQHDPAASSDRYFRQS